jgi:hypothetical protein
MGTNNRAKKEEGTGNIEKNTRKRGQEIEKRIQGRGDRKQTRNKGEGAGNGEKNTRKRGQETEKKNTRMRGQGTEKRIQEEGTGNRE